jgi:hypothetical protein
VPGVALDVQRERQPGVCERDDSLLEIEERVAQRAVVLLEPALVQDAIERGQHHARTAALGHEAAAEGAAAHDFPDEGTVECRGHAFSRHIADRDHERVGIG